MSNEQGRKTGWKQFVVLVSRMTSAQYDISARTHTKKWQVQIAEIRINRVEFVCLTRSFPPSLR